jgi:hypothetical protein
VAKKKKPDLFNKSDINDYLSAFCTGLYYRIKHGDDEHKKWLLDAINDEKMQFLERMNLE